MASAFSGTVVSRFVVRRVRLAPLAALAAVAVMPTAHAVMVPFTEGFTTNNSNWAIDSGGTGALWHENGGPGGGSYISRFGSGPDLNFGFFTTGPTLFRGQANFNSSGGAFVGNWIEDGVGAFMVDVYHEHSSALEYQVRFADPSNDPGASSINFSVNPSEWTTLVVPIVDSASSFQTYGSLGAVPNSTAFNSIFDNIGRIQISLESGQVGSVAPPGGPGLLVNFGIANPRVVAPVPEPTTWAVMAAATSIGLAWRLRRRRDHDAA